MACVNNHRCGRCPHPCKTENRDSEFKKFYTSLTIAEKEDITKQEYPICTVRWNNWTRDEKQEAIKNSEYYRRRGNKCTALGHDF